MCHKDLYDFAIKSLDDEQSRSTRIDQKSSMYITVISFMLGAFGVSWKWIYKEIVPLGTNLEYAIVIIGGLLFLGLCVTWVLLSICLFQRSIKHLRTKYETFYEIGTKQSADVYYLTVASSAIEPLKEAITIVNGKSSWLHKSYIGLSVNFTLLVIFIVIIGFQSYITGQSEAEKKNVHISIHTDNIILREVLDMNEETDSSKGSDDNPPPSEQPAAPTPIEAPLPDKTPPDIVPVPLDPLPEGNEPGIKDIIMEKTEK